MNETEVLEALMKLRPDYFPKLGKDIKINFFDKEARNLLLELGFSIMDPKGMAKFRKIYRKALKLKAEEKAEGERARLRNREKAIADAIKKTSGRLKIVGNFPMLRIKGTTVQFRCDCGRGKVDIDLAKDMHESGYIKVNGKILLVDDKRRKEGESVPMFGKARRRKSPAVLSLAKGGRLVFAGIRCPSCNFYHKEYEVAFA